MGKPHPKKVLNFGPEPEDQAKAARIEKWLRTPGMTYDQIVGLIGIEFGIKTSRSALQRFFDECNTRAKEQASMIAASTARATIRVAKESGVEFGEALEREFGQDVYDLKMAGAPEEAIAAAVKRYTAIAYANQGRRRTGAIVEQTKTDREKFEFNAAKAALKAAAELKALSADSTLDDDERITRARKLLWGKQSAEAAA